MKAKTLSVLAGFGALIATSAANADFVSISHTTENHVIAADDPGAGSWAGAAVTTYKFYVNFDNPNDTLTAVFGNVPSPMIINVTGAGMFNNSFGGNGPYNPAFAALSPSIVYDTYATIGAETTLDDAAGVGFSPGFNSGVFTGNGTTVTNEAWYTPGPTPQGSGGSVFFLQITIMQGDSIDPISQVGLQYRPAGANQDVQVLNAQLIPAPGALALLGVAGLVGTRRRRA